MQKTTSQRGFLKLAPIALLAGVTVKIDLNSIEQAARTTHHGEFEGTKVNSPQTFVAGESVVIWPEAGKPTAITMDKAALGVLSTQFLESQGYTVTKKAAAA